MTYGGQPPLVPGGQPPLVPDSRKPPPPPPEMKLAGGPSNGLRVEISCDTPTTTSDRQPVFHVTLRNESGRRLILPAWDAFTKQATRRGRRSTAASRCARSSSGSRASPLAGTSKSPRQAPPRCPSKPAASWSSLPPAMTEEGYVIGQENAYNGRTWLTTNYLLPPHTYRVAFCFENRQARIGEEQVWTGQAVSNAVEISVKPAPTDQLKIAACFEPPKRTYFLGEDIAVNFKATNNGEKPFSFETGRGYEETGRDDSFSFDAVDEAGKRVRDPVKAEPRTGRRV